MTQSGKRNPENAVVGAIKWRKIRKIWWFLNAAETAEKQELC